MKRNELIAHLRKKSETIFNRRKNDIIPKKDDSPMAQVMEALKQVAAKQDAIAQALAQIREHLGNREATDAEIDNANVEVNKMLAEMSEQ